MHGHGRIDAFFLTTGFIINSPTAVVRLRGLQINGAGNGITGVKVMSASKVIIENTVIDGFTQHGISVVNEANTQVLVHNTSIRNNVGAGINAAPTGTADISVTRSVLTGNGTAVLAGANSTVRISGNSIMHNTVGLSVGKQGKIISFRDNAVDGNGTNGTPSSTVVLQ